MLRLIKSTPIMNSSRTYKNFGHKRQPIPTVTVLWHGFLTFTFIGLGLNWESISSLLFGKEHGIEEAPWNTNPTKIDSS